MLPRFLTACLLLGLTPALAFAAGLPPDRDSDGITDELDLCSNTPPGVAVNTDGRPWGDLDGDCDADLLDFELFTAGFTGPMPPFVREDCTDGVDNDGDNLVDCADALDCLTGFLCGHIEFCSQFATCGCPTGYGDCDEDYSNGCELVLDNNPACQPPTHFATISGDTGAAYVEVNGVGEGFFALTLTEDSDFDVYLSAAITLITPTGTDYDLYLRCGSCAGAIVSSSTQPGGFDALNIRWDDDPFGEDDTYTVIMEVRYVAGECAEWELAAYGNVDLSAYPNTCDP